MKIRDSNPDGFRPRLEPWSLTDPRGPGGFDAVSPGRMRVYRAQVIGTGRLQGIYVWRRDTARNRYALNRWPATDRNTDRFMAASVDLLPVAAVDVALGWLNLYTD